MLDLPKVLHQPVRNVFQILWFLSLFVQSALRNVTNFLFWWVHNPGSAEELRNLTLVLNGFNLETLAHRFGFLRRFGLWFIEVGTSGLSLLTLTCILTFSVSIIALF